MPTHAARNGATPPAATSAPGFQMPARIVELSFGEDSEYYGAIVRCRRKLSLEDAFALRQAFSSPDDAPLGLPELLERARFFAAVVLVGWNLLDDDGEPLPATPDAFLAQPDDFVGLVVRTWVEQAMGVAVPLASPSPAGAPSGEPSETTAAS